MSKFNKINRLRKTSRIVSEKTGRSLSRIKLDILFSSLIYSSTVEEYYDFEFYHLNHKERKSFLTKKYSNKISYKLNNVHFYEKLNKNSILTPLRKENKAHSILRIVSGEYEHRVRISTYYNGTTLYLLNARMIFDSSQGMLSSNINEEGKIYYSFIDKAHRAYRMHPDSQNKFIGIELPHKEIIFNKIMEMQDILIEIPYTTWDFFILEEDVLLVDFNLGADTFQMKASLSGRYHGLKEYHQKIYL